MKFFSPNGGNNDYWKILGVNENFQPKSRIYIYTRFGQLLLYVALDQGDVTNGGQLLRTTIGLKFLKMEENTVVILAY